jgi:hypothetical protein
LCKQKEIAKVTILTPVKSRGQHSLPGSHLPMWQLGAPWWRQTLPALPRFSQSRRDGWSGTGLTSTIPQAQPASPTPRSAARGGAGRRGSPVPSPRFGRWLGSCPGSPWPCPEPFAPMGSDQAPCRRALLETPPPPTSPAVSPGRGLQVPGLEGDSGHSWGHGTWSLFTWASPLRVDWGSVAMAESCLLSVTHPSLGGG